MDESQRFDRNVPSLGGQNHDDVPALAIRAKIFPSEGTLIQRIDQGSQLGLLVVTIWLSRRLIDKKEGLDAILVSLEARVREKAVSDILGLTTSTSMMKETEIICTKGLQTLWSDRISGKVSVLAGNAHFWAVGSEDGCLQVYTTCGRRVMPTLMTGSAAVFIDCDECWKLLLVTWKGSLYLWDLFTQTCLIHDCLTSLLTSDSRDSGTIKIISTKLSKSGSPIVVLALT